MWNKLETNEDISNLMEMFGGFHDSCIKELKYLSGAFVAPDLSMQPINKQRTVKIIFQRQYENPTTIEMEFSGLVKLNLAPLDEQYTCELFGAACILKDGCIYWYDDGNCSTEQEYDGTWICAKEAKWRIADEYSGQDEVF